MSRETWYSACGVNASQVEPSLIGLLLLGEVLEQLKPKANTWYEGASQEDGGKERTRTWSYLLPERIGTRGLPLREK